MAVKRMNVYSVTMRHNMAGGHTITRHIAESGLTPQSAKNKVEKHYTTAAMLKRFGKPEFGAVKRVS